MGIPAEGRRNHAVFSEIAVLANLILDPPAHTVDPKELSLATVGELSRGFAWICTTCGTQEPLRQCFCKHFAARTPD
ncbi:hypothetical protein POF50_008380 [Streptomyces sp. SL13]|uniref:Uncharacterized protein n=1 Tax=Streptantibioticus silvisoli TaxID=2705255 RepID=A0AA90H338_9ACTN|nr:hypothetical protein [Streptantibioticus silvisoli]MDI5963493.1 hypothetical protein [Streptantibioticus silvisoli]MDI5969362.1 hypothetical protein [Streptantibioticus silvisoli]